MALSVSGLVLYKGGNGPWKVEAEDKSVTDVRDELDKIDKLKPRAQRRLRRAALKRELTTLSGKLVKIDLSDDGPIQVVEQEPVAA
jgi:hypothetical protein